MSKNRGFWLVGGGCDQITGSKLPSIKQTLCRFLQLHIEEQNTIPNSANKVATEIVTFWEKARIPTKRIDHVVEKIKKLYSNYQKLKKNSTLTNQNQKRNEAALRNTFNDLFDIAHADALKIMKIEEDRQFLLAQREKGRRGSLGPLDKNLAKLEQRRKKRKEEEAKRIAKHTKKHENDEHPCQWSDDSTSDSNEQEDEEFVAVIPKPVKNPGKRRPENIITPELASALDRTMISDRKATFVIAATAAALGTDLDSVSINKETIRLSRKHHRANIANEILESFSASTPLVIHWDGKLLPSVTKENVDRLAILVSGDNVMKLLGVPKITRGTGEEQSTAILAHMEMWGITDNVKMMSFDTTASNTGVNNGACALLEKKLERSLISLACRHHVLELILATVFDHIFGPSCGPKIKLFERFSEFWPQIDKLAYESGMLDSYVADQITFVRDDLIEFIQNQLLEFQPRDDYKELLQLALLFLGAGPSNLTVRAPGAYHRARWMAKLIYCFKIFLFRSQFRLTAREIQNLRVFLIFVLRCYLRHWYSAPCSYAAPRNDLELLQNLENFKDVSISISKAAVKTFSRHLWYINEELIGLSFFDPDVNVETKIEMVKSLEKDGTPNCPKRVTYKTTTSQCQLQELVTSNTIRLFNALDISTSFLQINPSLWENDDIYKAAKQKVMSLKVVNDAAERGIALITDFNGILCKQEEQKQFLLQVVEQHRKSFPNSNKSTIVQNLKPKAGEGDTETS